MVDLTKLGRYQLRRVLGKGAMGVVYEGFDPSLNRSVAVKTILRSVVTDEETAAAFSTRFEREAKAAARLSHPNIVHVWDFGEQDEVAYLVMEFIQGRELRSCFEARERFDAAEAVRIMGELLDALAFAHEAGVIHRDIKPANVMLDAQRHVKLADFGVARLQDASDRSKGGTMVGTPAFMSPEQISGKKVDRRSDLFSAGVILYQLLTGEQPFKGEGAWTVVKQIMQDEPPRPSTIAGKVSPAFDQIVNQALAKNPDHRFASAKDFAAAIQGALAGDPSAAVDLQKRREGAGSRASDAEVEFWRSIQNSDDWAEFEVYLKEFPTGIYADLARIKMAKLPRIAPGAPGVAAALAPPPPVRDTEEVSRLAEETARLEAKLAQREAEYRKREAEAAARQAAEAKARADADARWEAEAKARVAAEEKARLEPIEKAKQEVQAELAKREAEYQKREAEAKAKADAEAKARRDVEEKVRKQAEIRTRAEAEARVKRAAEENARREADAKARAEAGAKAGKDAEERARRDAEIAKREAELRKLEAAAPRRKAPRIRIFIVLAAIVAGAIGAHYWTISRDQARLVELTAALDAATQATQELNLARQRQEELLNQVKVARRAEDDARARGDQAKLQELREQTRKAEAEARKQAELLKKREAESKKAEDAARITDAKKQADAARIAAEKAAREIAAAEKAAAEKAALEKAAQEKAAQEKAAAEKAAEGKVAALKAAGRKGASQRAAQTETEAAGAEAAVPEELGLASGVNVPLAAEPLEPQLLSYESVDTRQPEKAAMTTKFDGTWSGTVVPSGPYECPEGKFEITVNRGNFGGYVTWYGKPGASSLVRGAWHDGNSARIRLVPLQGPAPAVSFVGEFKGQRLNAQVVARGSCTYELSLKRE